MPRPGRIVVGEEFGAEEGRRRMRAHLAGSLQAALRETPDHTAQPAPAPLRMAPARGERLAVRRGRLAHTVSRTPHAVNGSPYGGCDHRPGAVEYPGMVIIGGRSATATSRTVA
ncbi:hypothetical protein [Streptosporangium roseum]|uniref:hypothetical protein n=1 Tax=Streptosporangium roseum TaxID=2001 RepID=UPI0012DFBAA9|nr:hypothetical protein [Streptosporangium roseum]